MHTSKKPDVHKNVHTEFLQLYTSIEFYAKFMLRVYIWSQPYTVSSILCSLKLLYRRAYENVHNVHNVHTNSSSRMCAWGRGPRNSDKRNSCVHHPTVVILSSFLMIDSLQINILIIEKIFIYSANSTGYNCLTFSGIPP
jgi:hypothetical protein